MVNSQGNNLPSPSDEAEKEVQQLKTLQFRILDKLYTSSKGYKYGYVPLENLYEQLQANNNEESRKLMSKSLQYLYDARLIDSKAIAHVSIRNEGIKEYESAILGYQDSSSSSTRFPLGAIAEATTKAKEDEIRTIKDQRRAFLAKAYELSQGSSTKILSAFDIGNSLGYDQGTIERVYFYFQDEGVIKPFALGGKFTITQKGIELARKY